MNFTPANLSRILGKVFTEAQLLATRSRLEKQHYVPIGVFGDHNGLTILGPGTALVLIVRNCCSTKTEDSFMSHWLAKLKKLKSSRVTELQMIRTLEEKEQRSAAIIYSAAVRSLPKHKSRRAIAIQILTDAIPIAAARQNQSVDYLP